MAEDGGDEKASGRTPAVFISYASQDAAGAAALVEVLDDTDRVLDRTARCQSRALYADAIVRAIAAPRPRIGAVRKCHRFFTRWQRDRSALPPRSARLLRCESTLRR